MNAKFAIALALASAVLLVGCTGNVLASATIAPPERTATLPPTAVPTEVPTATPTKVPTVVPTPTEVPLYVGLSADEVEVLREQCLQENPDSACFPLPFAPIANTEIGIVTESWENYWGVTVTDGEGGNRFLSLEIPAGTQLVSPLGGEAWIRGSIPGYGIRWLGEPGRTIEGVASVSFGWGPFVIYNSGVYRGTEPSVELILVKGEDCTEGLYREGSIFEEADLAVLGGNRNTAIGEPVALTATGMCLQIAVIEPVLISMVIPPEGGGGTTGGRYPIGRTDRSDLLTDAAGSIVYVEPVLP